MNICSPPASPATSGPSALLPDDARHTDGVVSVTLFDSACRLEDVQRLFVQIGRDFEPAVPRADGLILRDGPCERVSIDAGKIRSFFGRDFFGRCFPHPFFRFRESGCKRPAWFACDELARGTKSAEGVWRRGCADRDGGIFHQLGDWRLEMDKIPFPGAECRGHFRR